jgi:hypothetical protein
LFTHEPSYCDYVISLRAGKLALALMAPVCISYVLTLVIISEATEVGVQILLIIQAQPSHISDASVYQCHNIVQFASTHVPEQTIQCHFMQTQHVLPLPVQ